MKKHMNIILLGGFIFTLLISNGVGFIRDGRRLDSLRNNVLRLHILADSNTEYAQSLKLKVRDGLLEANIFRNAATLAEAELTAAENLDIIEKKAEEILRENGCYLPVSAELADVVFDERVYEDITMPAGEYRALRVKIGSAQGKNWWCVMYPPLCLPAACEEKETENIEKSDEAEEFFTKEEKDILHYPEKYEVRFAVWDKIKELIDKYTVQSDEKEINP
ncbi:MAG: stage II sporulation protein R [Ruminococcus sp.]|nr:stage II sporulation protein R [Ruminococcus sp.]